jgi:hypothetical protein
MLLRCEGLEPPMSQFRQTLPKWLVRARSAFLPKATVEADISDWQLRAHNRTHALLRGSHR